MVWEEAVKTPGAKSMTPGAEKSMIACRSEPAPASFALDTWRFAALLFVGIVIFNKVDPKRVHRYDYYGSNYYGYGRYNSSNGYQNYYIEERGRRSAKPAGRGGLRGLGKAGEGLGGLEGEGAGKAGGAGAIHLVDARRFGAEGVQCGSPDGGGGAVAGAGERGGCGVPGDGLGGGSRAA